MRSFAELQAEIHHCRKCFPDGGNRPVTSGGLGASVLVIGQAPSRTDSRTGRTFSGPGGKRLREWFHEAGIDESDVYFSALTKCYPGPSRNGKGDRAPSRPEIENCRPFLVREIAMLQPRLVLLVGGNAIGEFLGKGRLDGFVGRAFDAREVEPFAHLLNEPSSRWIVPLPHCSGASLWLNRPAHRLLVRRALAMIRNLLADANTRS